MKKLLNHIILFLGLSILLYLLFIQFFTITIAILVSIISSGGITSFIYIKHRQKLKQNQFFFVVVFLVILFIPFLGEKESESLEKRNLKEFPEWRWSNVWKFFKEYQLYFDDRFSFRNEIIDTYGKLKYEYSDVTNLTTNVAIGSNRWLFYSESDYLSKISSPFTDEELETFSYNLKLITAWFKARGITYYLFIAPVKSRIYADELPDYMKVRTTYSRYNQLKKYLQIENNHNFITCDEELMKAKSKNEIYYKTDTHWNELGAFVGYSKIISVLQEDFPQLEPLKIDEFKIEKAELYSGDLLSMLGYESTTSVYQYVVTHKKNIKPNLLLSTVLPENPENVFEIYEMPNHTNDLNLFVVRDSYSENLKKFLSLNFKKSTYEWMPQLPITKIVKEQPNIVFHEMLERFSFEYLELPPEIQNDTAFINQFNNSN